MSSLIKHHQEHETHFGLEDCIKGYNGYKRISFGINWYSTAKCVILAFNFWCSQLFSCHNSHTSMLCCFTHGFLLYIGRQLWQRCCSKNIRPTKLSKQKISGNLDCRTPDKWRLLFPVLRYCGSLNERCDRHFGNFLVSSSLQVCRLWWVPIFNRRFFGEKHRL